MSREEKGKRRMVWLPTELDEKSEKARRVIGLGRSAFYRYAVIEMIRRLELHTDEV
jgi:hypothetical protein